MLFSDPIGHKRYMSLPEKDGRSEGFILLTYRNKAIPISFSCTSHNAQHNIVSHSQQRKIMHGRSLAM